MSSTNDVEMTDTANTTTTTLPQGRPTRRTATRQRQSLYVIEWKRIYPDKDTPQRIAGEDLPHVIPHNSALIGACTVRFILAPKSNTHYDAVVFRVTEDIHAQISEGDPTGELTLNKQISFPALVGRNEHGGREFYMDISTTTPTFFQAIANAKLYDGDHECIIKGKGAPVPANILTVSVDGLPAQTVLHKVGKDLYDALNKYRPEEIEVWDIFARYQTFQNAPNAPNFPGKIFACVRFKQCPPTSFPDDHIREVFPGWIQTRYQKFELHYAGRINHCYKCKENAIVPHTESECPNARCYTPE